jgi:hypothetical protein
VAGGARTDLLICGFFETQVLGAPGEENLEKSRMFRLKTAGARAQSWFIL